LGIWVYTYLGKCSDIGQGVVFHSYGYDAVIAFLRDLWQRATTGATPEQKSLF
jgi:hypothetical protein